MRERNCCTGDTYLVLDRCLSSIVEHLQQDLEGRIRTGWPVCRVEHSSCGATLHGPCGGVCHHVFFAPAVQGGRSRADAAEQSTGHAPLPEEPCMQCLPGSSTALEDVCARAVIGFGPDACMLSARSDVASPACDHHSANPRAADPVYTVSPSPSKGQAFCYLQNTHVKCCQGELFTWCFVKWPATLQLRDRSPHS